MKKLFKNLMLVAVAAMAFTACEKNIAGSEEQKEQNAQGATRITFTADFADDTRSGFDGKVGEAYKSKWHEGDKAKFVANRYGDIDVYCYYDGGSAQGWDAAVSSVAESTVSDANIFDVQFDSSLRSNDFIMAFAPAEQWTVATKLTYCYDSHECMGYSYPWSGSYSIPEPQTPQATSVDPMAHILKAEAYYSSDLATLKFEHQLAYGRMQIKNFTEEIKNVKVTIDSKTYTLNATNVENNLFWFGCEADEETSTVKVVVNTADKSYTKELDLTEGNGNGLPFIKGQVSKFGVDMEGVAADENTDDSEESGIVLTSFVNQEYYAAAKYGYQWNFVADGFTGSIYINNGKSTSELVQGSYSFNRLYADMYTPGFTASYRVAGGSSTIPQTASLIVEGSKVTLTLDEYVFVYTF